MKINSLRQEKHDRHYNLLFYGFAEEAKGDLEQKMKTFFQRQTDDRQGES